jgi:hypothetical protein
MQAFFEKNLKNFEYGKLISK